MEPWWNRLPKEELLEPLRYLFSHKDVKVRDYYNHKGLTESVERYSTIAARFKKLRSMGLTISRRQGGDDYYNAAITETEFRQQCAKIVVGHLFDGSTAELREALDGLDARGAKRTPKTRARKVMAKRETTPKHPHRIIVEWHLGHWSAWFEDTPQVISLYSYRT